MIRLLTISLLLFYTTGGFSQVKSEVQIQGDFPVKLSYDYKNKYTTTNDVLKLLAPSQAKNADQLFIQYNLKYNIAGVIGSRIVWHVYLSGLRIEQAVKYKSFDISQTVIPNRVDLTFLWRNSNNDILKSYSLTRLEIKGTDEPASKTVEPDTLGYKNSKLEIAELMLYFDDKQVRNIKERLQLIDDYYNVDSRLKEARNLLLSVKTDSLDKITEYKKTTDEAKKIIEFAKEKKFYEKLNLQLNDPVNFEKNLRDLDLHAQALSDSIQKIINQLYLAYYKKGQKALESNNREMALKYFEKSIELKKDFVLPYLSVISINQQKGNHQEALNMILMVYNQFSYSPDEKADLFQKAGITINFILDNAAKMNKNNEFEKALMLCDSCQKVSFILKGLQLPETYSLQKKTATQGIFIQKIEPAKKMLNPENVERARQIIDSAMVYAYSQKEWITDTIPARDVYIKILDINKLIITDLLKKQQYYKAADYCNNAFDICRFHNFDSNEFNKLAIQCYTAIYHELIEKASSFYKAEKLFSALQTIEEAQQLERKYNLIADGRIIDLLNQINLKRYNNFISEARNSYKQKNCRDAVVNFEAALKIQNENHFADTNQLGNELTDAAKCYISFILKQAGKEASKNQISQAQYYHALAKNLINRYQFNNDSVIQSELKNFERAVANQDCQNAQFDYDIQFNAALKFIEQKNFIEADKFFDKAIRISDANALCLIETKEAISKKEWLKPAIKYQNNFIAIDKLIELQNFPDFLLKFEENRQLYNEKKLSEYGIVFPDLYIFIKNQQPTGFINNAIEYYTERSDFEAALNLLHELYNRQISAERTQESQILLGMKLAAHDAVFNQQANPRDLVKNYIKDENWYATLKKTYLAEWKAKSKKK